MVLYASMENHGNIIFKKAENVVKYRNATNSPSPRPSGRDSRMTLLCLIEASKHQANTIKKSGMNQSHQDLKISTAFNAQRYGRQISIES